MSSGPKWSMRHGSQYQRLCARAGCGAAAVATLRFQSTQRQAWLVELDVNAARTQGDLCQRHAAALVLPRGWELHDERAPGAWAPVGSEARTDPAPKNGKTARRARAKRNGAADGPAADDAQLPGFQPAPVAAPEPEVTPEALAVAEAEPEAPEAETEPSTESQSRAVPAQFGSGDEEDVEEQLGEILDARTPLLQRAFRNAKPQ